MNDLFHRLAAPYDLMTHDTQTEFIQRALAGDRASAERLIDANRSMVRSVAYQALGNFDDAADVAQETLIYAVLKLPTLRDHTKFCGWLRQLTLSHCADYRRNRRTRRLGEPLDLLTKAAEEADFARRLAVRDSVAGLSEIRQTTLLMHYVGGWSITEIADLLHIPSNTVRSRLMSAKRELRSELAATLSHHTSMTATTHKLSSNHLSLIESAFPGARVLSTQFNPEPWQPFSPRVQLVLASGEKKTVDFRDNLSPARCALIASLERLDIPGPQVIHGPIAGTSLCLCEIPRGENLSLWTLGGTPHRIRLATERAIEGLDRLQGCTEGLLADPVSSKVPRRTLLDEIEILTDDAKWAADSWLAEEGKARRAWLKDPWFSAAVDKVRDAVRDIDLPLAYTDYSFFFPQGYRIQPATAAFDEPLGWPNDPYYSENPLVEFVNIFGHFGDPLLGLAMVWVQDCYPFVHTGFVEQVLWRRGVSRREFAPRLALKALQMVARDLPLNRPVEGRGYWDSLKGWAEQALDWM